MHIDLPPDYFSHGHAGGSTPPPLCSWNLNNYKDLEKSAQDLGTESRELRPDNLQYPSCLNMPDISNSYAFMV